jgi:predicted N-formylglutamate amidohydrolase
MKPITVMLSCEHGGNEVPNQYQHLFADHLDVLETHLALDIGALSIADKLHEVLGCDYIKTTVTRLLIDCNRRIKHPQCFSMFTQNLPLDEKQTLIDQYYLPYRQQASKMIQRHIDKGQQVLHLSIHSFVPELNGETRNAAISLLYDPKRHGEKEVARIWQNLMLNQPSNYRVRMNYPYKGDSDGFTSELRKHHPESDYLGIEVECNQALVHDRSSFDSACKTLSVSLLRLLEIL